MKKFVLSFEQFLNEARNTMLLDSSIDLSDLKGILKDPDFRKKYAHQFMMTVIKNTQLQDDGCYTINKSEAEYSLFFYDKDKEDDPNNISFYIKDDIKTKSDDVFAFALASPMSVDGEITYEIIKNAKGENAVFCFEYKKIWIGRIKNNYPEIFMSTDETDEISDFPKTGNVSLFITSGYLTLELAEFKASLNKGDKNLIDINKVNIDMSFENRAFSNFASLLKTAFKNNYIYIRYNKDAHYVIIGQESTVGGRQHAYEKAKIARNENADWEWVDQDSILIKKHTDKEIHKALITDISHANNGWDTMLEYDDTTSKGTFHTCEGFKILGDNDDRIVISRIQDYIIKFAKGSFTKRNLVEFNQRENQKSYSKFFDKVVNEGKNDKILINAVPRFGKTAQTLFSCITQRGSNKILVLSGQPTNVKNAWKTELYKFTFGTGFTFYEKGDIDEDGIDELNAPDSKFMVFVSLQSAGKGWDKEGNEILKDLSPKMTAILEQIEFDTIIVDECHFAASTNKSKGAIGKLINKPNHPLLVEMSGTPYKKIRSNEYSKDQVFAYTVFDDYVDNHDKPDYVNMNFISYDQSINPVTLFSGSHGIKKMQKMRDEFKKTWGTDVFNWGDYYNNELANGSPTIAYLASNVISPLANKHMRDNNVTNVMVVVPMVDVGNLIENAFKTGGYNLDVVNLCGGGTSDPDSLDIQLFNNKFKKNKPTVIITCGKFCVGTTLRYLDAICWCEGCKTPEKMLQYSMRVCSKYDSEDFEKRGMKPLVKNNGYIYVFGHGMTVDLKNTLNGIRRNTIESSPRFTGTNDDIKMSADALKIWEVYADDDNVVHLEPADTEEIITGFNKYNAFDDGDTSDYVRGTSDFDYESLDLSIVDLFSKTISMKTEIIKGDEMIKDKKSSSKPNKNHTSGRESAHADVKDNAEKVREAIIEALKRVPYLMYKKDHNIKNDDDFVRLYADVDKSLYGLDEESARKAIQTVGNKELLFSQFNASYRSLKEQKPEDVWEKFTDKFVAPTFKKQKIAFYPLKDILYKNEDIDGKNVMTLCTRLSKDNVEIQKRASKCTHFVWAKPTKVNEDEKVYSHKEYLNENYSDDNEYNLLEKKNTNITDYDNTKGINDELADAYGLENVIFVESLNDLEDKLKNMPKFDVAIMNPPYAGNLHLKILDNVIPLADEVINISPCTWAAPHNYNAPKGKWREKLNGKIKEFKFIPHREANDLFNLGNAIEDLAIIHCAEDGGNFDIMNYGFENKNIESIIKKLDIFNDDNILTMSSAKSRKEYGGDAKTFLKENPTHFAAIYQWHSSKNGMYDAAIIKDENKIKKGVSYFKFKDDNELKNFLDSLKTTFMDWYYFKIVVPGDNKMQAYMFRFKDYSKPWTNERFCKYFNITGFISDTEAEPGSEWEEILTTMEKYK